MANITKEIRVVSYFDNGQLYFVSDKALEQCGLIIGVEYTNTANQSVRRYLYMRKDRKYSFPYTSDVTDYASGGTIFFVGCFIAINRQENAVKKVNGKWVYLDSLEDMGTEFTYQDETKDGYRSIDYSIVFNDNLQSKYDVHTYFGDFASPIGTEIFPAVAGWVRFYGQTAFASHPNLGSLEIVVEARNPYREIHNDWTLTLVCESANFTKVVTKNEVEKDSYVNIQVLVNDVLREGLASSGLLIYFGSPDEDDSVGLISALGLDEDGDDVTGWYNIQTISSELRDGESYTGLTDAEISAQPWIKARKSPSHTSLLIGIKAPFLDGTFGYGYYLINPGSTDAVAIMKDSHSYGIGLTGEIMRKHLYQSFCTFVKGTPEAIVDAFPNVTLCNGSVVDVSSCWETETTRAWYCYGYGEHGENYDAYRYYGLPSSAQNIIDSDTDWSRPIDYNDVVDGDIDGDSEQEETPEGKILQERTSPLMNLHITREDVDEHLYFDADTFIKVRTNQGQLNVIDPSAQYNFKKCIATPVFDVKAGDIIDVTSSLQGAVKSLDVESFYDLITPTYEESEITFPYTVEEDGKMMFGVEKDTDEATIFVKITRAEEIFPIVITEASRRKKQLMSDDYIEISFSLDEAIEIPVGSYVDDEIFGRFFVVEKQMPREDKGAYDYTLKMVAWHCVWGNKKFMLTQFDDKDLLYRRKEMEWSFTGNLENHSLTVVHNLQALGLIPTYTKNPVNTGVADNLIFPYIAYGDEGEGAAGYARIAFMSKYKMAVGCAIVTSDGQAAFMEIGFHSSTYKPQMATDEDSFTISYLCFYSEITEGGHYIDAITGEEVANLASLTRITPAEANSGVRIGDYRYILVSETGSRTYTDSQSVEHDITRAYIRSNVLGMSYNGMPWYDDDVRVPLIFKNSLWNELELIINGSSNTRCKILIAVSGSFSSENMCLGAFLYNGREDGKCALRCWFNTGNDAVYHETDNNVTCPIGSREITMWGVFLCESFSDNSVTILVNGVMETFTMESDNDWATFLHRINHYSGYSAINDADSLNTNAVQVFDKYGMMLRRMARSPSYIYGNTAALKAAQNVLKGTAEASSLTEALKPTGGEIEIIPDNKLLQNYVAIDKDSIPSCQKALTATYNGTAISKGLSDLAEMFRCEYWVEYDNDYTAEHKPFKLCFGKCERGKEAVVSMGEIESGEEQIINIEHIDVSNDSTEFGNKLYAFGSNENIPFTYKRKVEPMVEETPVIISNGYAKVLLKAVGVTQPNNGHFSTDWFPHPYGEGYSWTIRRDGLMTYAGKMGNRYFFRFKGTSIYGLDNTIKVKAGFHRRSTTGQTLLRDFPFIFINNLDTEKSVKMRCGLALVVDDNYAFPIWMHAVFNDSFTLTPSAAIQIDTDSGSVKPCTDCFYLGNDNVSLDSIVSFEFGSGLTEREETLFVQSIASRSGYLGDGDARVQITPESPVQITGYDGVTRYNYSSMVEMRYGGQRFYGVINYKYVENNRYVFSGSYLMTPDFTLPQGTLVEVLNADAGMIPLAFLVADTDSPSSLLQLGENRLSLPENTNPDDPEFWDDPNTPSYVCVNGYVLPYNMRHKADSYKMQEKAVIFQDEYPKGILFVDTVTTATKTEYADGDVDGSQYARTWTQYTFKLKDMNGNPFSFDKSWATNETLKIRFLIPEDIPDGSQMGANAACKLAGMTFEVEFDSANQTYTIKRNEDFGAKLPNDILFPAAGDPCTLVNWNVKALTSTDLISAAEESLMKTSFEYAKAMKLDNFTLNLGMVSKWMFNFAGVAIPLFESNRKILTEKRNRVLCVRNRDTYYAIPDVGQRICVKHGSLTGGEMHTRILGYELKLDKPYDSPKIIVGESEAYSRLKKLEKNMTKLS